MSDIAAAENADSKLTGLSESLGEGDFDRFENLWMEILEDPEQLASSIAALVAVAGEGLCELNAKIKKEHKKKDFLIRCMATNMLTFPLFFPVTQIGLTHNQLLINKKNQKKQT